MLLVHCFFLYYLFPSASISFISFSSSCSLEEFGHSACGRLGTSVVVDNHASLAIHQFPKRHHYQLFCSQILCDLPEGLELGIRDSEGRLEVEPGDNLVTGGSGQTSGVGGVGLSGHNGRGNQLVKSEPSQLLVTVSLVNARESISNGLECRILSLKILNQ